MDLNAALRYWDTIRMKKIKKKKPKQEAFLIENAWKQAKYLFVN